MTKVNVVFFASLRESLGQASCEIELALPMTVRELKQYLSEEMDNAQVLLEEGIQSSIDFDFARDNDTLLDGVKEVAFFPPVTGG